MSLYCFIYNNILHIKVDTDETEKIKIYINKKKYYDNQ